MAGPGLRAMERASDSGPRDPAYLHQLVQARLLAFQRIGAPLMAAVSDWRYVEDADESARTAEQDAALFGELVETTAAASSKLTDRLTGDNTGPGDWARWGIAAAASDIVTACFRATGKVPDQALMDRLIQGLGAVDQVADIDAFSAGEPVSGPDDEAEDALHLRVKGVAALAPVVGAVARFAFGEQPEALVGLVADRVHARAIRVARQLAPERCPLGDWRALYHGVFQAAAELYADCHYAEMDRLLDMTPEERDGYIKENGGRLSMDPVWAGFELRIDMLTALAENLNPPEITVIDPRNPGG